MFKVVWLMMGLYVLGYGYLDKEQYVEKIRNNPSISYKTLSQKIRSFEGEKKSKEHTDDAIRDAFISYNMNSSIAIDFSKTLKSQIIKLTDAYGVGFYDFGFEKYGVLFDKDAKVVDIVLLAYSKGNNEWQTERTVTLDAPKGLFLVTDQYRNTEWITFPTKGDMVVSENKIFLLTVSSNVHFVIRPTSNTLLYQAEDKKLNALYAKSMKLLSKEDKKALKALQRVWIAYSTKKCNTFLAQATSQEKSSVHVRTHKEHCLYEETHRRVKELETLYDYLDFYK
jgi:hypothetical protein